MSAATVDWNAVIRTLCSGWPIQRSFPPATAEAIAETERRLGCALPASYRGFLSATNGLRHVINEGSLRPVERIGWLRDLEPDLVDGWARGDATPPDVRDAMHLRDAKQERTHLRQRFLRTALQISDRDDGVVWLLDPEICGPDGEWGAWCFANHLPGAVRFPTFVQLLKRRVAEEGKAWPVV